MSEEINTSLTETSINGGDDDDLINEEEFFDDELIETVKDESSKEFESERDEEYLDELTNSNFESIYRNNLETLNDIKLQGDELVHGVRVETDQNENDRRLKQELIQEELQQRIVNECISSSKKQATVSMKWPALKNKDVPQEIFSDINKQKEACSKIIESKERLTKELHDELRKKDAAYVKSLKSQSKDIDILISRMHQQIKQLTESYGTEMENIEEKFMKERGKLMQLQQKKIEKLKEFRRNKEGEHVKNRITKVEEFEVNLQEMRESELERYSVKKKELDDEIHDLEQQMDYMRGVYQLNAEKLTYYHSVLLERVEENRNAIRNNKAKLAKLQDQLSGIKAKYNRDDKKYKQTNHETTEQFKRIAKQYKDLIIKFKFFESHDLQQYKDIWKMNQKKAKECVQKLLTIDKVVTEQQLGLKWIPPENDFLNQTSSHFVPSSDKSGASNSDAGYTNTEFSTGRQSQNDNTSINSQSIPQSDLVSKRILQLLADEAGFLVEDKIRESIRKLQDDEGTLLQIDSILKSIGIENQDEIEKLMKLFKEEEKYIDELEQFEGSNMTKEEIQESALIIIQGSISVKLITPQKVIEILHRFIDEQQKSTLTNNTTKAKIMSVEERKKIKKKKQEQVYWKKMSEVVPKNKTRVWDTLENASIQYSKELEERIKLVEENEMIRIQNQELKDLLNQYMYQKINEELYVPPELM